MADAAAALIADSARRVLLMREAYGLERYGLPGGVIESGETPREAAVREVQEELGLTVEARELVAVYYLRTDRGNGLRFVFLCDVLDGEPTIPATGEVAEFVWAAIDDLPTPLTNTAPHAIEDWAAGRSGVYREIDERSR